MFRFKIKLFSFSNAGCFAILLACAFGCDGTVKSSTTINSALVAAQQYASTGARGVKVITSVANTTGSFVLPIALPTPSLIPSPYPGYDASTSYNAGVSAGTYFDLDGTTVVSKPAWLTDFQVGITALTPSSACATFGGTTDPDTQNFYRVSEVNCGAVATGGGYGLDPVFFRAVINRNPAVLGTAENLLVQVEYQASALHLNTDGTNPLVEDNLDQLWKVFWSSSLGGGTAPSAFSLFVPPNYGSCVDSGTGFTTRGNCDLSAHPSYRGASVKTKQFIIPLSALPNLTVLQFSRVKGRINQVGNYVSSFCTSADSPLCLGVVIRSVTLMRM